jgi:methionyl-tRNA formyltransferase
MTDVPRIAAFVSHHAGHAVLRELLGMRAALRVVLVATDDPEGPCCNASARIWRYGRDEGLRHLVQRLAVEAGLEAFTGSVRREGGLFHDRFVAARPDAIIAMVFGQRIPEHLLDLVAGRAWNVHPVVPGRRLAATGGPEPFEAAYRLGARSVQFCIHRMTGAFDDGEEVARSVPFPLPPATRPGAEPMLELQRRTAPLAAALVRSVLPGLFDHRPKAQPLLQASLEERNSP